MANAFVLMTALPPTKGHLHLIQFASRLAERVEVILCTQPDEPYSMQRKVSMDAAVKPLHNVTIRHIHKTLPQDPKGDGFWEMWRGIMQDHGIKTGDYIVSSEPYGAKLAEITGGKFMPYDPGRELYPCRGTVVRNHSFARFSDLLPEFQPTIRQTVTFFGAESTGKTTLSKQIARQMDCHWLFEWARPYLETVGSEITTESMTAIWQGQMALQEQAQLWLDKPLVIQDTDLFSTVGYWNFWNMNTPALLKVQAEVRKSDLYLITQSNIPFEADPIRYGGDKRESDDQYWIDLCEEYGLNYRVIESSNIVGRVAEATRFIREHWSTTVDDRLRYERQCNG